MAWEQSVSGQTVFEAIKQHPKCQIETTVIMRGSLSDSNLEVKPGGSQNDSEGVVESQKPLDSKDRNNCLPATMSCESDPERSRLSLSPASRQILASNAGIIREAAPGHKKRP